MKPVIDALQRPCDHKTASTRFTRTCRHSLILKCIGGALCMLVVTCLTAGCAGTPLITSSGSEQTYANGTALVPYMLPKALLPVRMRVSETRGVQIDVMEATLRGDPNRAYLLAYAPSSASHDKVVAEVDPNTQLLKSVVASSDEKSADIIRRLLRGSPKAEGASTTTDTDTIIFIRSIDPSSPESIGELNRDLWATFSKYRELHAKQCPKTGDTAAACTAQVNMMNRVIPDTLRVNIELLSPPPRQNATTSASSSGRATQSCEANIPSPPCSNGVCFRSLTPFRASILFGEQSHSLELLLPNCGAIHSTPVSRHAFVNAAYTLIFNNGLLSKVDVDKPSQGLALAALPLDIVRSVFATISEFIQLKIDLSGKNAALATAKAKEIEENGKLLKAMADSGKTENALLEGKNGVLLSAGTFSTVRKSALDGINQKNPQEKSASTPTAAAPVSPPFMGKP